MGGHHTVGVADPVVLAYHESQQADEPLAIELSRGRLLSAIALDVT